MDKSKWEYKKLGDSMGKSMSTSKIIYVNPFAVSQKMFTFAK